MNSILRAHVLCKRGGSSAGGGGGGASSSSPSSTQSIELASASEAEAGLGSWGKEINDVYKAIAGKETNKYSEVDLDTLKNAYSIGEMIYASRDEAAKSIVAVKDNAGNIQSAAVYTKKANFLYIDYLATAPWNFTNDPRATKGAGRKAIVEAIKMHKREGGTGELRLLGVDEALPFYAKLGFKSYAPPGTPAAANRLRLSAEDADILLKKFG